MRNGNLCGAERFPAPQNREASQEQTSPETKTKGAFKTGHSKVRLRSPDGQRLQDWEKTGRPVLHQPRGGRAEVGMEGVGGWLSTAEASRSSEVSPPHDVTNPSGVISLHTPTPENYPHHLPPTLPRQLSEDPQSGCDHRQGRRPCRVRQSRLLAPSLHTRAPPPPPTHHALASRLPGFQGAPSVLTL